MAEDSTGPGGIAIGIFSILYGLYNLLGGLAVVGLAGLVGQTGGQIAGLFYLVVGLGLLTAAVGLFTAQEWAWKLSAGIYGLNVLSKLYDVSQGSTGVLTLFMLALSVAVAAFALKKLGYVGGDDPSPYGSAE